MPPGPSRMPLFLIAFAAAAPLVIGSAEAADLKVSVGGVTTDGHLAGRYAYCVPSGGKAKPGPDISPSLSWSPGPAGTKAYAVFAVDPDVPKDFSAANKDGQTIAANAPRQNFYHWALVDIPAATHSLDEGADSTGPAEHGKPVDTTALGRRLPNDYGRFMGDASADRWGGWDGPCPPWNDERPHHYHIKVYALSTAKLPADLKDAASAEAAAKSNSLASGDTVVLYSLNTRLLRD